MQYLIHKPQGILSEYVKCIWCLDGGSVPGVNRQTLIPTGCIELSFYFGESHIAWQKDDQSVDLTNCVISGQHTGRSTLILSGNIKIISVLLKPEKAHELIPVPVNELNNMYICARDIFGNEAAYIAEQLHNTSTHSQRIHIIESYLLSRLQVMDKRPDARIIEGVATFTGNGGLVNINELAGHLNISKRQLERKFQSTIGLTPKAFARIIRFQKILAIKQETPDLDLTSLTYMAGYADQPHFINDFKSITNMTPGDYFKQGEVFSDYYSY